MFSSTKYSDIHINKHSGAFTSNCIDTLTVTKWNNYNNNNDDNNITFKSPR
jgi:hypothetical protein